jgi:nicotinate-nucleotide adenylyltransferase
MSSRATPPRWSEIIALFGGRFDPPHLGHAEAIRGLFEIPGVRQVWILPSPTPPHKPATASFEQRVELAKIGLMGAHPVGDPSAVRIDLREAERAKARPDLPTYTFDTLREIRQETSQIAFVIGTDQLEQLHTWYRFPDVLGLSHWIVLARKPQGQERSLRVLNEWEASGLVQKTPKQGVWWVKGTDSYLTLVPTEAREVSSTRIREQIARTGEPPQNALSEQVLAYLKQNGLYGIRSELKNYD